MAKYIFQNGGGFDYTNSDFFNNVVDQATQPDYSQQYEADNTTQQEDQPEESDYIKNLRAYDAEQPNDDYKQTIQDLEQRLNARLDDISNQFAQQTALSSDDGVNFLNDLYDSRTDSSPVLDDNSSVAEAPNTPAGFAGIFKVEGARTGQPTNLNSSAIGRGQMVKGTRLLMYKKLGITDTDAAEQRFKFDPSFEAKVLQSYKEDLDHRIPANIQGTERQYMLAKGWYTGDPNYPDNVVPHPEAGNRLTARKYALHTLGIK